MGNKHGLTDEERDEIASMELDDLRILIEGNIRKTYRIQEDKRSYSKSCNDFIKHLEAKTKHAIKVTGERAIAEGHIPPGEEAPEKGEAEADAGNVRKLPDAKGKKPAKKPAKAAA